MDRWGIPLLGLLALLVLCWYCVRIEPDSIEEDLFARSTAALQAGNIPTQGLSIAEQTATLTGPRGSLIVSDDAMRRVASVWGVTEVVVSPTGEVAAPPAVILSPQVGQLENDLSKFLQDKNVRFEPASDVILPEGRQMLDELNKILATAPNVPVEISGHTDSDGNEKLNVDLSKRRAAAVKRYLASKGVAAARLSSDGFGSAKPVADNASAEGKARNRRIEFHAKAH